MNRQLNTRKKSPAYQLVQLVWDHETVRSEDRSWIRLNQALYAAVILAIEAKMPFALADFSELYKNFSGGYWFGNSSRTAGENFYTRAVEFDHASACHAFEAFAERKPFILDTGARAAHGTQVEWEGLSCKVTEFLGPELISLCHYAFDEAAGEFSRTPTRRFKVMLDEWREAMRARLLARTPPKVDTELVEKSTNKKWKVVRSSRRGEGEITLELFEGDRLMDRVDYSRLRDLWTRFQPVGSAPPSRDGQKQARTEKRLA